MKAIVNAEHLTGIVQPPASKSMMQRVCAAALLHTGTTTINNAGHSADDKAALSIIKDLGAIVSYSNNNTINIASKGVHPTTTNIHCGESGLSARLFIPIAAISDTPLNINGTGTLLKRSMYPLIELLNKLQVHLESNNWYLPFSLQGPIVPNNITIDGSESSQYLTGALFACCAIATAPITIEVTQLNSKPYVDLTLQILKDFDFEVYHEHYKHFTLLPASHHKGHKEITIETDWSSAANWMVAAAIKGSITIQGLSTQSVQADKMILNALADAGVAIEEKDNVITVTKSIIRAFEFDATDCPDLLPLLSILAAQANGTSKLKGLNRLPNKESNRIESIAHMLTQFGVDYQTSGDTLRIEGRKELLPCTIDAHHDHRIAMAAAIGALATVGAVTIEGAEAVNKSYPDFFRHYEQLNGTVTIQL